MDKVILAHLLHLVSIIDDLLVITETFNQHLLLLSEVVDDGPRLNIYKERGLIFREFGFLTESKKVSPLLMINDKHVRSEKKSESTVHSTKVAPTKIEVKIWNRGWGCLLL